MNTKRFSALIIAVLLICSILSFGVSALRLYDVEASDYIGFSEAVIKGGNITNEIIVKSTGSRPDFRTLCPVYTVEGPDHIYLLRFSNSKNAAKALATLQSTPGIAYAEANAPVEFCSTDAPAPVQKSWGIRFMKTNKLASWIQNNRPNAYASVAVIDTGVYGNHPVFQGRIVGGKSYDGTSYKQDTHGHGTNVAGIIAQVTEGLNVGLIIIKAMDKNGVCSLATVSSAIRSAADSGADVINISFVSKACSQSVHDAVAYAMSRGSLPVICTGNEKINMDKKVCCPAHLQEPIVVSGCTSMGAFFQRSGYGSAVDLCAPAYNVYAPANNGGYKSTTGTSFAAAHVSAIAAMYKLCYPDADAEALASLLTQYTSNKGIVLHDKFFGYGIPAPGRLVNTLNRGQ